MRQQKLTAAQEQVRQRGVGDYNFPIAIVTWVYVALALLTLGVWQYHALWKQNSTLTRPAFVYSRDGLPIIEYNPRIALITNNMWAGNIYDRNGLLLATSDNGKLDKKADHYMRLCKAGVSDSCIKNIASARTKRYYPFGESLFFMVGNQNYGLFFNYDQDNPIGYMAEAQYLSYLRNFDNLHDENGNPTAVVKLKGGENKSGNRYLNTIKKDTVDTLVRFRLRDYHQLVEFMKTGVHGKPLKKHNNDVRNGNFDLKLTVDAALQADMQKRIINHVNTAKDKKENYFLKNNSLLRISVVIMDAQNGELLTSANYPMPNYQRLREEVVDNRHTYYSDNYLDSAYTDRDLGLTYQTYPGSTAKVMSAMSGFEKMGTSAADKEYFITSDEIIEKGTVSEPHGHVVTMREAIVLSSNCYFINLVNDNDLYWNLDSIYETVGAGIGGVVPYFFNYGISGDEQINFREKIRQNQDKALVKYAKRIENGEHDEMNEGEWRWAWGQGYKDFELQASPLNMARVASAVVNGGKMPFTQFVLSPAAFVNNGQVRLLSGSSANILKNYMIAEAANQKDRNGVTFPAFVGGKTGTPERNHYSTKGEKKKNDGWYMFFIDGSATATKRPLAVCVRMERGPGSGAAVKLTKSVVLEALYSKGYITNK